MRILHDIWHFFPMQGIALDLGNSTEWKPIKQENLDFMIKHRIRASAETHVCIYVKKEDELKLEELLEDFYVGMKGLELETVHLVSKSSFFLDITYNISGSSQRIIIQIAAIDIINSFLLLIVNHTLNLKP